MSLENNFYKVIGSLIIILGASFTAHLIKKAIAYRELKKYKVEK